VKCNKPILLQAKTAVGGETSTGRFAYVPCGKCTACRMNYASSWAIRILHEAKEWEHRCFVTLTYDDAHLPHDRSLDKKAVSSFLKRLRKNFESRGVKFFASGEYGEKNHRPHYHLILFGVSGADRALIEHCWPYGFVSIGDFSVERARYVAGYAVKKLFSANADYYKSRGLLPEFSLMSRRPGIGERWLSKHSELARNQGCVRVQGSVYALPRYYRDRIYTEEDKMLIRAVAQDFYAEKRLDSCIKSGGLCDISLEDYLKQESAQRELNLQARIPTRRL